MQTRVDEELDDALRAEARRQRTTVSQLIRNVLSDTFQLVDDIVAQSASLGDTVRRDALRIADSARGLGKRVQESTQRAAPDVPAPATAKGSAAAPAGAAPPAVAELPEVDAWQEVVMAKARTCARCGRAIAKGERGYMGIVDEGERPWVCAACGAAL